MVKSIVSSSTTVIMLSCCVGIRRWGRPPVWSISGPWQSLWPSAGENGRPGHTWASSSGRWDGQVQLAVWIWVRVAMTAAASKKMLAASSARLKPEVRASGVGRVGGEQVVGVRGGDSSENGQPEGGAELLGGVE